MEIKKQKNKGLGRGLEVLLGPISTDGAGERLQNQTILSSLPIQSLKPGQYQPRTRMDEVSLGELAESIKRQGVIQPIIVRSVESGDYEIIAGERRFRAALLAGLVEVPVVIREVPNESALAMALIENIQREDLNPLEEAQGVQRLIKEFNLTHEQAAEAIGRSRSATSNMLRLLQLTLPVQTMLLAGDLEMGHARALLPIASGEQVMLAQEIVNKRLTVREAEKAVSRYLATRTQSDELVKIDLPTKKTSSALQNSDIRHLEENLSDWLAAPVQLQAKPNGTGLLTIKFGSLDELDAVLAKWGYGVE